MPEQLVTVATCATREEATAGQALLADLGMVPELRPAGERTEILVPALDALVARRALLDDRLEREGRIPQEMSLVMKLMLVIAFLAVVAFAVLTVTLG